MVKLYKKYLYYSLLQSYLSKWSETLMQIYKHNMSCLSTAIGEHFKYGRQEDAHEFLKYLLAHMEESYLKGIGATEYDLLSKQSNPISQIFGGFLRQQGKIGFKRISLSYHIRMEVTKYDHLIQQTNPIS